MEFMIDGKSAYAYTAGHDIDPRKPTVVFIHGAGNDHTSWTQQSRYFAYHGRNVLSVDLPGHGRSAGPPLDTISRMADWIAAVLDEAKIERAAIVGHSMGSLVALDFAARHSARADKAVLAGTVVPMPVSQVLLDAARDDPHRAYDMVNIWGHAPASYMGANHFPGLWMMGYYVRLLERNAPDTLYRDFVACNAFADGFDDAARVKCPTLLVLGRRDAMTPANKATELAASIAGSRTVVIETSGHALMAEEPDRVRDELIAFLL
jgi:pimeloyl-ACP methyl ester carboxylesterase